MVLVTEVSNTPEKKLNRGIFKQLNKELAGEATHIDQSEATDKQRLKELIK